MRILLWLLLLAAPVLAQSIDTQMTVYRVVQKASDAVGTVVKWRGMAEQMNRNDFVLRAGPYRIKVRHSVRMQGLTAGEPVIVTGKVLEAGAKPVVELISVVPVNIEARKQTNWNLDIVTQEEARQIEHWYDWVRSFNRRLPPEIAGTYVAQVFRYSRYYRLDPRLVLAVMAAESGFEKDAVSGAGAIGLGQLMPGTAAEMGIPNPRDPLQNILGSTRFLHLQMNRWSGHSDQISRALASYNAGPGAVEKYNGVPPYAETRSYVTYVRSLYRELGGR